MSDTPRIGDNVTPPYAEAVAERLELDYAELLNSSTATIDSVAGLPTVVETAADVADIAGMVVKLRDLAARSESHRKAEKEPYLRSQEAVDAFFFRRIKDPLDSKRRDLNRRLDDYKQLQLAEERARREAEAAAARKMQEELRQQQQAAEAAARRARSEESVAQRQADAARIRVEASMAEQRAEDATLATMVKSGRMVGERFEGERSGQVTMRKTPIVFIDDVSRLDLDLLRPFLKEEHILMALKSWAKSTGYTQEMPGATVALRDTTVVR